MEHKFITFSEAIELLRLSRQTVNRLIARREIPNYKVGKRRLFDEEELVEWVKSHRDDTPSASRKEGRVKKTRGSGSQKKGGRLE